MCEGELSGKSCCKSEWRKDVQERGYFFARDRLRMHHVEKEDPFYLYTHSFPKSHWMGFGKFGAW